MHFGVKEEEFKEAMRAEVGTTSLCTTTSSKMDFHKVSTGADIINQHQERICIWSTKCGSHFEYCKEFLYFILNFRLLYTLL